MSVLAATIVDDGKGGANPQGSGLAGLRKRVRALDGRLDVISPPGRPDGGSRGDPMRVIICEDHALVRDGLERLLRQPRLRRGGVGRQTRRRSSRRSRRERPDVCVVDVRLPPSFTDEGVRAAIEARRQVPGLPILILSQYVEQTYARELLTGGEGGVGYLLKDRVADPKQFVDAVRRVADGGTALDPEAVARLLGRPERQGRLELLTPREREVLSLMAEGRSNSAIADAAGRHRARRREARLQHLLEARPAGHGQGPPPRAGGAGVAAGERLRFSGSACRFCRGPFVS